MTNKNGLEVELDNMTDTGKEEPKPQSLTTLQQSSSPVSQDEDPVKVLVVGRPNAGKTSVFNRLTGAKLKTGNYHGVTVEHAEGSLTLNDHKMTLIDLPGTPSLVPHSPDEGLTAAAILNGSLGYYDFVMVVVDALRLLEGLYLGLQVIELGRPTLIVINQIDLARQSGLDISIDRLEASFTTQQSGKSLVKAVSVSALTGEGFEDLEEQLRQYCDLSHIAESADKQTYLPWLQNTLELTESDESAHQQAKNLIEKVDPALKIAIEEELAEAGLHHATHLEAYLSWLSLSVQESEAPISPKIRLLTLAEPQLKQEQAEKLITKRYRWLDQQALEWMNQQEPSETNKDSNRIDQWILHPLWGSFIFISVMILLFQALFVGADPFIAMIEDGVAWLGEVAGKNLPKHILSEFIIEGLINGIGNVLVFLPQVLILFGLIGLMEDSGYMARASALTDRVMRAAGLSGRAFVPMLSGFICAVPAILATRTLPQRRDRLLTMMALPLLTCSARLPVYTLLIATLLPDPGSTMGIDDRAWVMVILYLFATLSAFMAVWVMGKTILKGETPPLLIHLPDYRKPVAKDVLQRLFARAMVFVKEAGSVIFVGTVILWLLLSFPRIDKSPVPIEAQQTEQALESKIAARSGAGVALSDTELLAQQRAQSYGGQLGRLLEPALRPLGWDWQVGVGLIGAFAAREVFVSTLGMVYGVGGEVDEESTSLRERIKQAKHSDGTPVFTPISALALLIFFSLACQCLSTLAAVKRETAGYRWPLFMFTYMSILAYSCALIVTWIGRILT